MAIIYDAKRTIILNFFIILISVSSCIGKNRKLAEDPHQGSKIDRFPAKNQATTYDKAENVSYGERIYNAHSLYLVETKSENPEVDYELKQASAIVKESDPKQIEEFVLSNKFAEFRKNISIPELAAGTGIALSIIGLAMWKDGILIHLPSSQLDPNWMTLKKAMRDQINEVNNSRAINQWNKLPLEARKNTVNNNIETRTLTFKAMGAAALLAVSAIVMYQAIKTKNSTKNALELVSQLSPKERLMHTLSKIDRDLSNHL